MKRREFILKSLMVLAGLGASVKQAFAEVIWVKKGIAGYVEKAPPQRVKKNEKCMTCNWFKDDGKVKDGGLCNLKAVNKGKVVYVKKEGVCNMWQKKAKA